MIVTGIIAFIISLKRFRKHKELRVFCYLLMFDLTQIATTYFAYTQPKKHWLMDIMLLTTLAFMVFENIVCTRFIHSQLMSRKRRLSIVGLPLFLVAQTVIVLIFQTLEQFHVFAIVDCITLTIPCLLYFYELFVCTSGKQLKSDPVFWVITGILFLKCGSLPLWMSRGFTEDEAYKASSLNFLLYSVFFVMLMIAFLCPPAIKTEANHGSERPPLEGRENIEPIN